MEACGYDSETLTIFQKSPNILGTGAEFPYLGIWGPKHKNGHSLSYSYLSHWEFVWNVLIRQASSFFGFFSKIIAISELCHQYISNEISINLQPQRKLKLKSSYRYNANEPSVPFQSCCKLKLWICFVCLGPKCLNMEILIRIPIVLFQRAVDHCIMYQTKISIFLCFGPQVPKYGNLAQIPKYLKILKHYQNFGIILSIRAQRPLNHRPIILQTQNMPVFCVWAPNVQI